MDLLFKKKHNIVMLNGMHFYVGSLQYPTWINF